MDIIIAILCVWRYYGYKNSIADSAEDVQVGCNSEFHAARQSSDN